MDKASNNEGVMEMKEGECKGGEELEAGIAEGERKEERSPRE